MYVCSIQNKTKTKQVQKGALQSPCPESQENNQV